MSYFFPEYFRVDMSQEDIDNGFMGSVHKCALALAVTREMGDVDITLIEVDEGRIDFIVESLEENDTEVVKHRFSFALDDSLYLHGLAFDLNKEKVKPVNIHFNITSIDFDESSQEYEVYGDACLHEDFVLAEVVPTQTVLAGTSHVIDE